MVEDGRGGEGAEQGEVAAGGSDQVKGEASRGPVAPAAVAAVVAAAATSGERIGGGDSGRVVARHLLMERDLEMEIGEVVNEEVTGYTNKKESINECFVFVVTNRRRVSWMFHL